MKNSFLPGYTGFNLNRNWLLSKVKINLTQRRSGFDSSENKLLKENTTHRTTYTQIMALTKREMASVLGRSTFHSKKKNLDLLAKWVWSKKIWPKKTFYIFSLLSGLSGGCFTKESVDSFFRRTI